MATSSVLSAVCLSALVASASAAPKIKTEDGSVVVALDAGGSLFAQVAHSRAEVTTRDLLDSFTTTETTTLVATAIAELKSNLSVAIELVNATIPFRESDGIQIRPVTSDEGIGMAIGVTRAPEAPSGAQGPDEELDPGGLFTQVTVSPNGHVGLGIDEPLERLHVNGNVKAEGDCSCGEVNVNEELEQLQNDVQELRQALLQTHSAGQRVPRSCADVYNSTLPIEGAAHPLSGYYTIVPLHVAYTAWCEFDDEGIWVRVGPNATTYNWVSASDRSRDISLIDAEHIRMLRDVSIQQGGFRRYKSHCNMQLFAQADDSSNMHRLKFHPIAPLMTGSRFNPSTVTEQLSMTMEHGSDNTRWYNRGSTCTPTVHPRYGTAGCVPNYNATTSCNSIFCTSNWRTSTSCGLRGMPAWNTHTAPVLIAKAEFRPRDGYAHRNQWSRNRYTARGNEMFTFFKVDA